MTFNPKKSRSLIILKRRTTLDFQLTVQGETIPYIFGNPIKCLGKWYYDTLGDNTNMKRMEQVSGGMRNIDTTGFTGKFKA